MKKFRTAAVLFASLICIAAFQMVSFAGSFQYTTWNFSRCDQVSADMVNAVVATLDACKDDPAAGNYRLHNTGIYFADFVEGKTAEKCLEELFMGDKGAIIVYGSFSDARIVPEESSVTTGHYSYTFTDYIDGGYIFVGWYPDSDPYTVLSEHYQSKAAVDAIVAGAPERNIEKARYFHDTICSINTYDYEGYNAGNGKHYAYSVFTEGTSVCSGYAQAFFNLSFYSGLPVATCGCITDGGDTSNHAINAINVDGVWKEIDTTWDDGNGIKYTYFLRDMDESWQNMLNGPTVVIR